MSDSLERILSKKLPDGKLYVKETNLDEHWHRHVKEHGPGPKAYAIYNVVMCDFEERRRNEE